MSDNPTPPGNEPAPSEPTPTPPASETAPAAQPAASAPAPAPAPVPGVTAQTPESGSTPDPADVEKNKVMAVLAYIGLLVLVPILAAKESPFARYHANQGIILFIGGFALSIVFSIISFVLGFIPVVNCLVCVCAPLPMIAWLAYAIIGILNATNGKLKPLPGVPPTLKILK